VADFYRHDSEFVRELGVRRTGGKRGRADVLLVANIDDRSVMIGEAKYTDWDVLAHRGTVHSNLLRHARQVWSYFDATIITGDHDGVDISTCHRYGALIYPRRPLKEGVAELVEDLAGRGAVGRVVRRPAPTWAPWGQGMGCPQRSNASGLY
jgi:hypothetical protein